MKLNLIMAAALVLSTSISKAELQEMNDTEMREVSVGVNQEYWILSVNQSEVSQDALKDLSTLVNANLEAMTQENKERFLRLAGMLENNAQNIQIAQLPMQLLNQHLINQYQKEQTEKYNLFQEMISSLSNSDLSKEGRINQSLEKAGNAVMNAIQNIGSNGVITGDKLVCPTGLNSCIVEKGLTIDKKGLGIISNMQILGLDWKGIQISVQFKK